MVVQEAQDKASELPAAEEEDVPVVEVEVVPPAVVDDGEPVLPLFGC